MKAPSRASRASTLLLAAVLAGLCLVVFLRLAASWRYFDRFLGDDGWVLRVAQRVAAGDVLYRDVAWVYGPLPVYGLGWLLRLSPSVVWAHVLDFLLAVTAIAALYVTSRQVVSRRTSLVVTAWAALLGSSTGLISHVLDAYTSAVSWGLAASLVTVAAGCIWVQRRSQLALVILWVFALLAALSKPEFGLAALAVVSMALWLRRPSRRFQLGILGALAGLILFLSLRLTPATLAACWRGYSGYDQLSTGAVGIFAPQRVFGSLLGSAAVGACLWWTTRQRSFVAVSAVLAAFFLLMRLLEGGGFLHAASLLMRISWLGTVPALLWAGWRARSAALPPAFWILWIYSLTVSLRWFCLGSFQTWAAGTVALVGCLLVRHRLLHRPAFAGWLALCTFLLLSSVETELDSWRKPRNLQPVATVLGTVRLPPHLATNLESMRARLDAAPAGGLFVAGGGPGWYLLGERANPTRFDVVYTGIGTTEPERSEILATLRAHPPAVILFEREFHDAGELSPRGLREIIDLSPATPRMTPDGRWSVYFTLPVPSRP